MDEKDFKRHLKDLVHGHHHPEEHDWAGEPGVKSAKKKSAALARKTASKAAKKPRSKPAKKAAKKR